MSIAKHVAEEAADTGKQLPVAETSDDVLVIRVNKSKIMEQAEGAGEFIFDPKAESEILKLLALQKFIDNAVNSVKGLIEAKGVETSAFFSSVTGDNLKATYQASGQKYRANPAAIKRYNPQFFERKVVYSLDSAAVARYEMKHHGKLPANIERVDRKKNVVLRPDKGLGL